MSPRLRARPQQHDAAARFTGRASAYAATRPSYPRAVVELLAAECELARGVTVCDLGSGTGILTELLLDAGASVIAVEPNADMRAEAEERLGGARGFRSVNARAEATTLGDASVDLVTAAQAFHWFDVEGARAETARILRPGGWAALVWNDRDAASTPFHVELEALIVARCTGYRELQGRSDAPRSFDAFFGAGAWSRRSLPNAQRLEREGLVGRIMSTSFAPAPGTAERVALAHEVRALFDRHEDAGAVTIRYATAVVFGHCVTARRGR